MVLSEEQMRVVEPQMATIGYMLANYKRFGDAALEISRDYFYELGKSIGQNVKKKMGITESDANAVAAVVGAVIGQAAGVKPAMIVKGDKVISKNSGFCPVMEAVKILNAPWQVVCSNYAWRWFEGIAAGVNPNVKMEVPESRSMGKDCCFHIITVPK